MLNAAAELEQVSYFREKISLLFLVKKSYSFVCLHHTTQYFIITSFPGGKKRGGRGGRGRGKKVFQSSDEENSLNISEEQIDSKVSNAAELLNEDANSVSQVKEIEIHPHSLPPRKFFVIVIFFL